MSIHTGFAMLDHLVNLVTGLGTKKDPTVNSQWHLDILNRDQLEKAYRGDWIARRVVDAPAEDATREWRNWQASQDQIEKIEELETDLFIQRKLKQALIRSRLYGGAALVLGVDDGLSPDQAIDFDKLKLGCLKFVVVLNRYELTAGPRIYDVESEWYTRPEYYTVATPLYGFMPNKQDEKPVAVKPGTFSSDPLNQQTSTRVTTNRGDIAMVNIHPSRVIEFAGAELPDWRLAPQGGGWGDSILQTVEDALKDWQTIISSVSAMASDSKVDVVKIPQFAKRLSDQDYSTTLINRFALANTAKSMVNTLMLDADEQWERVQTHLEGYPNLIREMMTVVAGAGGIPVSRLMGQAPGRGLSSSGSSGGEQDLKNYYDGVASMQETTLRPLLIPLDKCVKISTLGKDEEDVWYEWAPLYQQDPKEIATIALQKAQAFQVDVNCGVINEDVLREARANQLIEDKTYPGFEDAMDEYGLEPQIIEARVWSPGVDPVTGKTLQVPGAPPGGGGKGPGGGAGGNPGGGGGNPALPKPTPLLTNLSKDSVDNNFEALLRDYSPDQERDERGRFSSGGGRVSSTGYAANNYGVEQDEGGKSWNVTKNGEFHSSHADKETAWETAKQASEREDQRQSSMQLKGGKGVAPYDPYTAERQGNEYDDEFNRRAEEDNRRAPYYSSQTALLYHGTMDKAVSDILKNGLVPQKGKGADEWAKAHGMNVYKHSIGDRGASVYIADDPDHAEYYANLASSINKAKPVIIPVRIPAEHLDKLVPDELDISGSGYRFRGKIKPEWIQKDGIKAAHVLKSKFNKVTREIEHRDANGDIVPAAPDDGGKTVYLVVLVKEPDETQDYDPNQPRDPRGRWAGSAVWSGPAEGAHFEGYDPTTGALGARSGAFSSQVKAFLSDDHGGTDIGRIANVAAEHLGLFSAHLGHEITKHMVKDGVNDALYVGLTAIGAHIGGPVAGAVVGAAAGVAVNHVMKKLGITPEAAHNLLTTCCSHLITHFHAIMSKKASTPEPEKAGTKYKQLPLSLGNVDSGSDDVLTALKELQRGLAIWNGGGKDVTVPFDDFNPNHDLNGRFSSAPARTGSAAEFFSPNQREKSFDEAAYSLKGDRQRMAGEASAAVDSAVGLDSSDKPVIGAWADGAENSIMSSVHGADPDKLRLAAAMKGHLLNQKSVLTFRGDDDGPATLYTFHSPDNIHDTHTGLLQDGVHFHTIEPDPSGTGATVHVADLDGSAQGAVARAAERLNAQVTYQHGHAEFVGTTKQDGSDAEQRADARGAYEAVIGQSPVPQAASIWSKLHNRWSAPIEGLKDALANVLRLLR